MQNNYLLESESTVLIKDCIDKIIKKNGFDDATISSYDLEEVLIDNALEDIDTYSFLSSKKVIIIKNLFLEKDDKKIEHLLKYIDNPNKDNLLIITTDKIDSRLALSKKLTKSKNITYKKIETDPFIYTKNKLSKKNISDRTIRMLVEKCRDDITRIDSECEKLLTYKIDNDDITEDDINLLVIEKLGDSSEVLFSLVSYILQKDKKNAFQVLEKIEKYGLDVNSIIGLLASQLKLILQIKILKEEGLRNVEIQDKLNVKSIYQIKKLSEYTYYSYKELDRAIISLANLDLKIKSGKIDTKYAINLFMIEL